MEIKIYKGKALFNNSKLGNEKNCIIVEFPNCFSTITHLSYKWMPTYKQLEDIKQALDGIEKESWEEQK